MYHQDKPFSNFHRWAIVLSAALCFYYNLMQITICNTLGSYFTTALDIKSPVILGYFTAVYLYATMIFLFPAGILIDKFSVKKIATFFIALSALSNIGLAFTTSLPLGFIFRFLAGIAGAFSFLPCLKLAPMWFSSKKLGSVIGVCTTIGMCGGLTAQLPVQWLLNIFGGRIALLVTGIIGLIIFIIVLTFVNDHPTLQTVGGNEINRRIPFKTMLAKTFLNKQTWCASLYIGFINLPIMILGAVWGVKYLTYSKHLSAASASSVTGMIFLGAIFGMSFFGWFSDKLQSRKLPMHIGSVISIVLILMIILLPCNELYWLLPAFLILGFITSSQVIGYPVVTESNEDRIVGSANALANIIVFAVASVLQPFFGYLIEIFSKGDTFQSGYTNAMYSLPICFILAIILTIILRETFQKH